MYGGRFKIKRTNSQDNFIYLNCPVYAAVFLFDSIEPFKGWIWAEHGMYWFYNVCLCTLLNKIDTISVKANFDCIVEKVKFTIDSYFLKLSVKNSKKSVTFTPHQSFIKSR